MTSLAANAAPLVGALGFLCSLLGVLGANRGILPPITGFLLFAVGLLIGGALAVLLGLVGLLRTRSGSGRGGASQAWSGLLLGVLLIVALFALSPAGGAVPIHDITTNPDDPPAFVAVLEETDNADRDLTYPHGDGDVTAQQRAAYPDLETIVVDAPADAVFANARAAVSSLGWELIAEDAGSGRIEAKETTAVFRFVDDVVIRVRAAGNATTNVDVRSTSRVGQSDLGANAERIRRFRSALLGSAS